MSRKLLDIADYALTAGQVLRIMEVGKVFQILDSSADVKVEFRRSRSMIGIAQAVPESFKWRVPDGGDFHEVAITSAVDQTLRICISQGDADVNVQTGSVTATIEKADTFTDATDVTLTGAADLVLAANANTRLVNVTALDTNAGNVRIGAATVAANRGTPLQPGQTLTVEVTAAIYAIGTAGDKVAISIVRD